MAAADVYIAAGMQHAMNPELGASPLHPGDIMAVESMTSGMQHAMNSELGASSIHPGDIMAVESMTSRVMNAVCAAVRSGRNLQARLQTLPGHMHELDCEGCMCP